MRARRRISARFSALGRQLRPAGDDLLQGLVAPLPFQQAVQRRQHLQVARASSRGWPPAPPTAWSTWPSSRSADLRQPQRSARSRSGSGPSSICRCRASTALGHMPTLAYRRASASSASAFSRTTCGCVGARARPRRRCRRTVRRCRWPRRGVPGGRRTARPAPACAAGAGCPGAAPPALPVVRLSSSAGQLGPALLRAQQRPPAGPAPPRPRASAAGWPGSRPRPARAGPAPRGSGPPRGAG